MPTVSNSLVQTIQKALENSQITPQEGAEILQRWNQATDAERGEATQLLDKICEANSQICSILKNYNKEENRKVAMAAGLMGLIGQSRDVPNMFGPGGLGTGIGDAVGGLRESDILGNDGVGVGGLGTRGVGAGAGGAGLGINGIGLYGKGQPSSMGTGNLDLGGRGEGIVGLTGKTVIKGGLSKDVIGRIIRINWIKIKYAYELALQRNSTLEGTVIAKFAIDPKGKVTGLQITSDTIKDQQMLDGINRAMSDIRFPAPGAGVFVDVKYPFLFEIKK